MCLKLNLAWKEHIMMFCGVWEKMHILFLGGGGGGGRGNVWPIYIVSYLDPNVCNDRYVHLGLGTRVSYSDLN